MTPPRGRSLCVVLPYYPSHTETFIRSHIEGLAAKVVAVHGWRPRIGNRFVLAPPSLIFHKLQRMVSGAGIEWETTAAFLKVFRRYHVEAVLAEYGDNAVRVVEACRRTSIPLIVHFHGYDGSVRSVLEENAESYLRMFAQAGAIIAVSRAMQRKLVSLGAPADKVHYNPYGVDCKRFSGANPGAAPPSIIAVGRFAEKKAPQLTLASFALVHQACAAAKLRMIGNGPLLSECRRLARELG